uniref:RUN domain-containing protein n=1 Tax=Gongylonema pulchrum TaxID=637853 RepID=A0A183EQM3_9BILA
LLQHFEEFSLSNDNFALFVLLGAYANEKLFDGLLLKCAIWDPCRNIVRQMTTKKCHGVRLVSSTQEKYHFWLFTFVLHFLERTDIRDTLKEKHFSQYSQLLAMYAAAIKNNRILRDRNPLVFEIASCELGLFIRDHEAGRNHENTVSYPFSMLKS